MATIFTKAHVPDELMQAWLHHMRDFDTAHPGCHFQIMADAPNMSVAEIQETMKVSPGLRYQDVFERKAPEKAAPNPYRVQHLADSLREHGVVPDELRALLTAETLLSDLEDFDQIAAIVEALQPRSTA